ncbi:hypothetical protein ACFL6C_03355 [Myxococcota bacterium]
MQIDPEHDLVSVHGGNKEEPILGQPASSTRASGAGGAAPYETDEVDTAGALGVLRRRKIPGTTRPQVESQMRQLDVSIAVLSKRPITDDLAELERAVVAYRTCNMAGLQRQRDLGLVSRALKTWLHQQGKLDRNDEARLISLAEGSMTAAQRRILREVLAEFRSPLPEPSSAESTLRPFQQLQKRCTEARWLFAMLREEHGWGRFHADEHHRQASALWKAFLVGDGPVFPFGLASSKIGNSLAAALFGYERIDPSRLREVYSELAAAAAERAVTVGGSQAEATKAMRQHLMEFSEAGPIIAEVASWPDDCPGDVATCLFVWTHSKLAAFQGVAVSCGCPAMVAAHPAFQCFLRGMQERLSLLETACDQCSRSELLPYVAAMRQTLDDFVAVGRDPEVGTRWFSRMDKDLDTTKSHCRPQWRQPMQHYLKTLIAIAGDDPQWADRLSELRRKYGV